MAVEALTTEGRLGRLEDIEAIKVLKSKYAFYIDKGYDLEGLKGLFTEDAIWTSNAFGEYQNRADFLAAQKRIGEGVDWALHFLLPQWVDVATDRETATGTWALLLLGTFRGEGATEGTPLIITATYNDMFVREKDGWKFKEVKVHFHQASSLHKGWVQEQFWGT